MERGRSKVLNVCRKVGGAGGGGGGGGGAGVGVGGGLPKSIKGRG